MSDLLQFTNETLTTVIAITAVSMLLYNLVRNLQDRVTRASSVLLGCVSVAFVTDGLVGLDTDGSLTEIWFRLQWIGIAFTPAALLHLADALLATTGLESRGRRRRVIRILYIFSAALTVLAAFTNTIVHDLEKEPVFYMRPGPLFVVYTIYFVVANWFALQWVRRARRRCLTTSTRRRMTYLLSVFLTPGLGIYPYSMLFETFGSGKALPVLPVLIIFNLANLFIVFMLLFMSYPLSFFGNNKPDRVVKTELLHFLLRGPFTASVVLAVMVSSPRISEGLHIKDDSLLILSVVGTLLAMQWGITYLLPRLENWLIYTRDQEEARQLRRIGEGLLTRADIRQLQEAVLAAVCDQLRAPSAFITALDGDGAHLEQVIGEVPDNEVFKAITTELPILAQPGNGRLSHDLYQYGEIFTWRNFWLFPLRVSNQPTRLLGIMGVWLYRDPTTLSEEESDLLTILTERAAKVLADQRLQAQVFETLNEFVSEMESMRSLGGITRYGQVQKDLLVDTKDVHSALRDFWGGKNLSESGLVNLKVVQKELEKHGGSATRALQSVLTRAIESLKPNDERNRSTPEWILYNILEMRFMQGKKVRDVAPQLFMSEPDFYRKQKIAIEEVARRISDMERSQIEGQRDDIWAADA